MRTSQTYMRSRVLEVEKGICQHCGLHAHELFLKVRDTPPSKRKEMLENTWLAQLSLKEVRTMFCCRPTVEHTSTTQRLHFSTIFSDANKATDGKCK